MHCRKPSFSVLTKGYIILSLKREEVARILLDANRHILSFSNG